jgi:hypothetical protein
MSNDIDVRPIPVDRLSTFEESALADRHRRLVAYVETYSQRVVSLCDELEEARRVLSFVEREKANAELAQQLIRGDVVRVICPTCDGTGMKPADVAGGRIHQGTAFESSKAATSDVPVIDERNRCVDCTGQRWIIMPRFKG